VVTENEAWRELGDLAGSYPNPSIAANAVGGGEVADGSLTTSDYGYASGTITFDMASVLAQSCGSSNIIFVPAGASNDPVVVTPSDSWIGVQASMTYNTRLVGGRSTDSGSSSATSPQALWIRRA
jgi:hypothetical protein